MSASLDAVHWVHGAADCAVSADPLLQTHQVDDDTFILRQSKCFSYEGNFLYIMFGNQRAILFDTGAPPGQKSAEKVLPVRNTVETIITKWLARRGIESIDLIVAHTHSHVDHVFWDGQFAGRPDTSVVKPSLSAVTSFFGLPNWPEGQATLDLGTRELIVIPLPGHEITHIAVYDRRTEVLLTGDTLYPGLLTVQDWAAYRRSAARLVAFAAQHPVSLVLGNHIELKNAPGQLYKIGTTYQPDEHTLPLTAAHLQEWHAACDAMANSPHRDVHKDFIIDAPWGIG